MNKRLLTLTCAIVMLATLMIPLVASATTWYVYTSNGKGLNFRSEPDYNKSKATIMGSIPYGAAVDVLDFMDSDYWAHINYKGRTGYVMTRYLQRTPPAKKHTTTTTSSGTSSALNFNGFADAKYNALIRPSAPGGFVNLRWAPSKSMAVRDRLYDGQALEVIAQDKTWAQVRVSNTDHVGFVMRSFLTQTSQNGGDS